MKIRDAKTTVIRKSFVDLPSIKLYIEARANSMNQITGFHARYNGNMITAPVVDMKIEEAWKQIESFIAKHANNVKK